jgi:creatinine amidohydrolase/Fe(II)-dependent formamide hydrolase-like protein
VGLDTIVVVKCLELLEKEREVVILPPFYFGAASHAVAAPEGTGTLHADADKLLALAGAIFTGLLRIGFRNIHAVVHHQTENFIAGMPTDLAFKLGARQAIFSFLEKQRGEGWWGRDSMAGYYGEQASGSDPFNWIKLHRLMPADMIATFPFDHAGMGETSLMLALAPEGADMGRLSSDTWFTANAAQASAELGQRGVDAILSHLRRTLV